MKVKKGAVRHRGLIPWTLAMLAIITIGGFSKSRQAAVALRGVPQLQQAMATLGTMHLFASECAALRARIPELEELVARASGTCGSCVVDVIYQAHVDLQLRGDSSVVQQSQLSVLQLLESNSYPVIATEGSDRDDFSAEAFAHEINKRFGMPIAEVRAHIVRDLKHIAPLQYSVRHPESEILGAEDQALNQLHAKVVQLQSSQDELRDRLEPVSTILRAARSEVALARLFKRLVAKQQTRGCLVIGNAHSDSIQNALLHFGVAARVFDTVPVASGLRPVSDPR